MKIGAVQLQESGDSVVLSAECILRHFGPDTIYFKFDKKYRDFIVADASPFAAALLVPAMKLGQDLIIEGTVSEKFYYGLQQIVRTMVSWNIGLQPISITADRLTKDTYTPTKVATFFSGGVDSFYTYLKNKKDGEEKIRYFILADGYDISLRNKELWDITCEAVADTVQNENIEIIKTESNVRNLIEPIFEWTYTFGGCLAALGLALRKELKDVLIASAYSYDQMIPDGAHPDIDHFRGTETLSFHHDGAEVTRLQKTLFISHHPAVLKHLRVCYRNKKGKFNCGRCDKCLRTMISLHIAGVLEQSMTFPHAIDIGLVKKLKIGEHGAIFQRENLLELERLHMDLPLQNALRGSLNAPPASQSYVYGWAVKLWFLDYFYNRGRAYKVADFFRRKFA